MVVKAKRKRGQAGGHPTSPLASPAPAEPDSGEQQPPRDHAYPSGRNPAPEPRAPARLGGPKAGRLLRTLIDVRPPYG